ncbi:hypothetical protein DXD15_16055 [Blautia sp. TF11-31AT]|nr:hypothetical protein DXD15_16055 [Blautia sp. TF11-31AT]
MLHGTVSRAEVFTAAAIEDAGKMKHKMENPSNRKHGSLVIVDFIKPPKVIFWYMFESVTV